MMWLVNTLGFRIHGETLRVDKSYCIFNDYFELPIHQESEIIVPFEHSVELVQTIRDVVLTNNFPVDYITEVLIIMVNSEIKPFMQHSHVMSVLACHGLVLLGHCSCQIHE